MKKSYEKMKEKLLSGSLDELNIEIEVMENSLESNPNLPPEMQNMQDSFIKIIGVASKKLRKI